MKPANQPNQKKQSTRGVGWRLSIYVISVMLVSCALLAANIGMVFVFFTSFVDYIPAQAVPYIGQFTMYVGPYLLLFLEWQLWDSLADPFRRYQGENGAK